MKTNMNQMSFAGRWVCARVASEVRNMVPTRYYVDVTVAFYGEVPAQGRFKRVSPRYVANANHHGWSYYAMVTPDGCESGEVR